MAAVVNTTVQLLASPITEWFRLDKQRRHPILLLGACVWSFSVVTILAFGIIYFFMAGIQAEQAAAGKPENGDGG